MSSPPTALPPLWFAVSAALRSAGAMERLELLTLDARYRLGLGRKAPGEDVVIAWIDQESMDYLDENGVPFPWPREVYAQVLEHLLAAGARGVVFDVLFDQRGYAFSTPSAQRRRTGSVVPAAGASAIVAVESCAPTSPVESAAATSAPRTAAENVLAIRFMTSSSSFGWLRTIPRSHLAARSRKP